MSAFDPDWLVPDWPAPAGVRAVCTTRAGGVSTGAFASLNLGTHVGDRPDAVAANRARLQQAIGAQPVFLEQVHGVACAELTPETPQGSRADASHTRQRGVACTIMVADCLPVLFCDAAGTQAAAAHAGWRGLAAGVLERTCESFGHPAPVDRAQPAIKTIAWIGPCIGPKAFEVGAEVRAAFLAISSEAQRCFRPAATQGKWLADLPALARQRLRTIGVQDVYGNDGSDDWCTVTRASRFFSHRRDRGITGRFAACIWLG